MKFVYFTVEPSYERTSKIKKIRFSLMGQLCMYFSARAEGRISYGHLGRTNSCFMFKLFSHLALPFLNKPIVIVIVNKSSTVSETAHGHRLV